VRAPLQDIEVLEIGQFVAAPYACEVLADLGARVTKVEPPEGDGIRSWGPHVNGESAPFMAYNRGKRSVALDFREQWGREAILRLYERVDIVVENNRPGVLNRYGLDAAVARSRNPGLIFCSISGYGSEAPGADRPGFDLVIQGVTGIMSVTGLPEGPPVKVGVPIVDGTASLHAVVAILAALHARATTHQGSTIDVSLQAASMTWMVLLASGYFATGQLPRRLGSAHPLAAPYQAFRASDGYLTMAVGNDRQWHRLCSLIGLEHLRDNDRFRTNQLRAHNQVELAAIVEAKLGGRTRDEWVGLLQLNGIPADRINSLAEAVGDPALKARGTVIEFDHPLAGLVKAIGSPVLLDGSAGVGARPPLLGEHTQQVLAELGLLQALDGKRKAPRRRPIAGAGGPPIG
jgi:crotonobetainyl-CoA:carnitine CoA-transferase CaiB-like acyl-CoA transferase